MKFGIRNRVLLIAWGPAALISIAMAGYFISSNLSALRSSRRNLGLTLSRQLAPAAQYGVLTRNRALLDRLIRSTLKQTAVSDVTITTRTGHILANGHRIEKQRSLVEESATFLIGVLSQPKPEHWVFQSPIVLHQLRLNPNLGLFQKRMRPGQLPKETIGYVHLTLSARHVSEQASHIILEGILLMLAGLIVTFILADRMSRSIAAPLVRMSKSVQQLAQGMMSIRLHSRSSGELGQLEQGINQLAAQIEQSTNQLEADVEQATQELRETLEEVEIKNVALDLARKQAVAASRAKTDFLANINHEIRTPMNTILGYVDFLAATSLDADQREYLSLIQRSSQSLLELIDQVLRLSRIEAGHLDLVQAPCEIEAVIEDVIMMLAPYAWQKGLDLISDIYDEHPSVVLADAGKLRQIFSNLIGNAIKFTEHGLIRIIIRKQSDAITATTAFEFTVEDSGVGLSSKDLARIFEPFTQADSSATRTHGGVGLGLAICHRLIEAMKGTIRVESEPDQGSRFTVHLTLPNDVRTSMDVEMEPHNAPKHIRLEAPEPFREHFFRLFSQWGIAVESDQSYGSSPADTETDQQLTMTILDIKSVRNILASVLPAQHPITSGKHLILAASAEHSQLRQIGQALHGHAIPMHIPMRELRQILSQLHDPARDTDLRQDPMIRDLLRQELPLQVAALRHVWASGKKEAIRDALHQLDGTAGFLKLAELKNVLNRLHHLSSDMRDGQELQPSVWAELDTTVSKILEEASSTDAYGTDRKHPDPGPSNGLAGLNILLAEDNAVNRTLLVRMLNHQGARVRACSSGETLVHEVEQEPCDVVLLDIHMPGVDGIQIARALTARYPGLPLVAVSADVLTESRLEAMNAGIRKYLVKPIRESDLALAIRNVLDLPPL